MGGHIIVLAVGTETNEVFCWDWVGFAVVFFCVFVWVLCNMGHFYVVVFSVFFVSENKRDMFYVERFYLCGWLLGVDGQLEGV